jgi:HEAT repeat protein
MPIVLTDSELDIIFNAARPLAVQDRDAFLQEVAARLAAPPHLGDGIVHSRVRRSAAAALGSAGRHRSRRPAAAQVWNALETAFRKAARELGCDPSEERLQEALRTIGRISARRQRRAVRTLRTKPR